jgi:hypothetical protein
MIKNISRFNFGYIPGAHNDLNHDAYPVMKWMTLHLKEASNRKASTERLAKINQVYSF